MFIADGSVNWLHFPSVCYYVFMTQSNVLLYQWMNMYVKKHKGTNAKDIQCNIVTTLGQEGHGRDGNVDLKLT